MRLLMSMKRRSISFQDAFENYESLKKFIILYQKGIDTRMAIFILDNEFSLAIEVKDDDKDSLEESAGLATYSNSESTVFFIYPYLKTYGLKILDNLIFN